MAGGKRTKKVFAGHLDKKKGPMEPSTDHNAEKQPSSNAVDDKMNIYLRLMKNIPIEVKKSDTIQKVRTEFSDMEGVSLVNLKSLFFAGNWLENERTVADYDITNGSIINIYMDSGCRFKVHVNMSQINKIITLDVDMRDTILAVKQRIQHKEGFAVSQQELIYLGEELNDSRILASYNIVEDSAIYAFFRVGDAMHISISFQQNKRKITLRVKTWYTIEIVKNIVESIAGIPRVKQRLYSAKIKLGNQETLADLHISQGNTLELVNGMQIFLKKQLGKRLVRLAFEVDGSNTIANLCEMIEERERSITRNQFALVYDGRRLEYAYTFNHYEIEDGDEIQFYLHQCGC